MAAFAPDEESKAELKKLGTDKEYFSTQVARKYLNIAQVMEKVNSKAKWTDVPFSLFIESVGKIQPRYYSISSSAQVQPKKIAITAVVEEITVPGEKHVVKGVTTNYLLALKQKQHGEPDPDPHGLHYAITGPRNKYDGIHVPVHVRHSNFKLPSDPAKPIIMVGPGTGVAPFRGFIQERVALKQRGENVGETVLFYGCRKPDDDFLYREEWEEVKKQLGDSFTMHVAFSREQKEKVYVQHLLKKHGKHVNELLQKSRANFYVCGDAANMAREVNNVLAGLIAEHRGKTAKQGEEVVKSMRAMGVYQEDVWS